MTDDYSQPILNGSGASDYERYLRTDELLALQRPPEERIHRDELLFQVVHQSAELWLKLAGAELEEAIARLGNEDVAGAVNVLGRAHRCLRHITTELHMLEHLSPWEYTEIRKVLGHGSGFDSPGFRRARVLADELGARFHATLERRGVSVVEVYQHGRELDDLYRLAEALIEWDEGLILWRMTHVKVVQRVIGAGAIGTQGTPVDILVQLVQKQAYPELWEARNELTRLAGFDA